jgi:chemotaxis protein CheY-P-specific phosphatase CheC
MADTGLEQKERKTIMDLDTLSDEERIRFMNLCRDATESTSQALGVLLNRQTENRDVSSPTLVNPTEFAAMWGGPDTSLILIAFGLRGGIKGNLVQIFDQKSAAAVLKTLAKKVDPDDSLSEKDFAVLSEVGNISVSSFISAMMKSIKAPCIPTVPTLVYDGTQRAMTSIFGTEERRWEDSVHPGFLMKTRFNQEPEIETALYLEIDSSALREFLRERTAADTEASKG